MLLLYSATLFVSAFLLFLVQPMVAKLILPLFGGTSSVWSTCMVFFQTALLGGYLYAHASATCLQVRQQMLLHVLVLALAATALPLAIAVVGVHEATINPALQVLRLLGGSVGFPLIAISATAPLLQRWFSHSGHRAAGDPYFLYAASNLGSILALLGYPTLIEPNFSLSRSGWSSQTQLWSMAYGVLVLLTALSARVSWPQRASLSGQTATVGQDGGMNSAAAPSVSNDQRLHWLGLSFAPSSLLLSVTAYITMDIAAVPLLWVLPLALYLLSYILTFGRWPLALHQGVLQLTVPIVLISLFLFVSRLPLPTWTMVTWHLLSLFVIALSCHGLLALKRPSAQHLTEFYLWVAAGGALGGLFNALLAPMIFSTLVEYPLGLIGVCLIVTISHSDRAPRSLHLIRHVALPLLLGLLSLLLFSETLTVRVDADALERLLRLSTTVVHPWLTVLEKSANTTLVYAPVLVAAYCLRRQPWAMQIALLSMLLASSFVGLSTRDQVSVQQARSFFGGLEVLRDRDDDGVMELRHGYTVHGRQSLLPARRGEPLTYYHRLSPIGQLFTALPAQTPNRQVAVIGLGVGTLAAYARPGDTMTFYEIDPLVSSLAFDTRYFSYLSDARARGVNLRTVLGDGRVQLAAEHQRHKELRYDLIILDAFTSDAIPVHLLTREALQLYLDALTPAGILALHISNRHLYLDRVVAGLAADAHLDGRLLQRDATSSFQGAIPSTWALLARTRANLNGLADDPRWQVTTLDPHPSTRVWSDDFYDLLSVMKR